MKLFCQILLLTILLSGVVFFTSLSLAEAMGFEQAHNRGVLTAYEVSYFSGLGLSILAIPVALVGLISGLTRKKPVLYPLLAGVAGVAYALCLFVIPVIQSLNERAETETEMMNNTETAEQPPAGDVLKAAPED
jgi:hypothetical protein